MPERKKTLATPWRYALGMFGTSIGMSMMGSRGTFFYTEFLGLGLQYIALVNVLYVVWDAVNDPLFGYCSDRTRTRFGRRRPWLLLASPVYLIVSVFFYIPPSAIVGNMAVVAVWYTVLRMLTETTGTVMTVNYHALLPELFKDEKKRTDANAIRQALQIIGMIIGIALVPLVIDRLGYPAVAITTGVIGVACFLFSVLGCREDPEYSEAGTPRFFESIGAIVKNRNFWFVGFAHLFLDAVNTIAIGAIPYYVKYALQGPSSHETFLSGAIFVIAIPSMLLADRLVHRFGARPVWRVSMAGMAAGFLLMSLMRTLALSILAGVLIGICFAGVGATLDIMQSKLMDEDTRSTGYHREAFIFSVLTFLRKLSGLLVSLVFLLIFLFFGFESGQNPGAQPDAAARVMMTVIPAVLMLAAFFLSGLARFGTEGEAREK